MSNFFSERLQHLLALRDWDQKDLADKTGITAATISRYITNKASPNGEYIKIIAETLNVSADYLLGLTDVMNANEGMSDMEIYTLAANNAGYEGELTEQDLDKIKLAMQIALANKTKVDNSK